MSGKVKELLLVLSCEGMDCTSGSLSGCSSGCEGTGEVIDGGASLESSVRDIGIASLCWFLDPGISAGTRVAVSCALGMRS